MIWLVIINPATEKIRLVQCFDYEAREYNFFPDENGEPMVVYHGTKDNFNEFDSKKQSNKGFWFTPKKNLADGYSMARNSGEIGNVFSVFLNIKNPANNDWVSKSNPKPTMYN